MIEPIKQSVDTAYIQPKNTQEVKINSENKKSNTGLKVALGTGLAALAAVGTYIATKGKSKAIKPNILEKTLSNGNRVVIEEANLLTNNGIIPARTIKVYDKLGNIVKQKSKAITKDVNKATGKKYTTIYQGFYDKGNFVGKNEINRYYSKGGALLLKVNKSTDNKGYQVITKQAPVGRCVLEGEKRQLASNALKLDNLPGTSAMAQAQRTNGLVKHTVETTAEDARNTIKIALEKGFSPRSGELKLEKL